LSDTARGEISAIQNGYKGKKGAEAVDEYYKDTFKNYGIKSAVVIAGAAVPGALGKLSALPERAAGLGMDLGASDVADSVFADLPQYGQISPRIAGSSDFIAEPARLGWDVNDVAGPNPNGLRQRAVDIPTAGEGGVYLKPEGGLTVSERLKAAS
jgi:hypothetical protein